MTWGEKEAEGGGAKDGLGKWKGGKREKQNTAVREKGWGGGHAGGEVRECYGLQHLPFANSGGRWGPGGGIGTWGKPGPHRCESRTAPSFELRPKHRGELGQKTFLEEGSGKRGKRIGDLRGGLAVQGDRTGGF